MQPYIAHVQQVCNQSRKIYKESKARTYDAKLTQLTVQNNFLLVTQLDAKNDVWKRIMDGLPAGQMSFLLRAGVSAIWGPP